MARWTPPTTDRPQPMTKNEIREMLAQAVRNTQPEKEPPPKGSKDRERR